MRLLLYPDGPEHRRWQIATLRHYAEDAGVQVVRDPMGVFDVAVYFSFHRTFLPLDDALLRFKQHGVPMINIGCWDISKSCNEATMLQAAGYNTMVDPAVSPVFLEKNEEQGRHDIRVCDEFNGKRPGYIYVKRLNNIIDGLAETYRVYVFQGEPVLVGKNWKREAARFGRSSHHVRRAYTRDASEFFSADELMLIRRYCELYPVEFTELDVVRDLDDGRIYVVDNNNMPAMLESVRGGLEKLGHWRVLCDAFKNMLQAYRV